MNVNGDFFTVGPVSVFRWGAGATAGKWIAVLCFPNNRTVCFVHVHCVVSDFGDLVPVGIEGMTATGFIEHREFLQ